MINVNKISLYGLLLVSTTSFAADMQNPQSLMQDCYQEWQSRGWTLGADRKPAEDVIGFRDGIMLICEVRTELFLGDENVSPYIQGRLRDLAPFVFTASKVDIKQRILQMESQTGYPAGSGFLSE